VGITIRQKIVGKGQPWHVFIHGKGIIRSKKIGDRKAAEAVASQLRRKMALGEFKLDQQQGAEPKRIPEFSEYVEHYMKAHATPLLKLNTSLGYRVMFDRHLLPVWTGKHLDEIQRRDIKQLLLQKQKDGLAAGTISNILALVSSLFSYAYEEEILKMNPALKLGKFIQKSDSRRHAHFATAEQVAAILNTAKEHFPDHYTFMLCAFRTGMRLGELLGLAREDLNFDASTITVSRSFTHGHWSTPKSHKTRQIEMSDQLKMALQVHLQNLTKRFGGTLPTHNVPGGLKGGTSVHLVFPNEIGGAQSGDNLRSRMFGPLIKKAGVPSMRIHDCRHTYASMLLQAGAPVIFVRDQMGHASITTTCDTYGHILPHSNRNAVNKLDDLGATTLKIAG